ncbi:HEPN family nuclease [Cetobacterium sp. SF1]|uniref:HEPN family nuclease n=1 Tax=Cetobacterium sp. SF1 TaxID=3417654 RepID=UPI003CEDFD0E
MKYDEKRMMEDFLKRTFKILEQYNAFEKELNQEFYDVTLLTNCLFGIIVMPKSHWHKKFENKKFNLNSEDIKVTIGGKETTLEGYNVGFIMNSLRNSLAHWGDTRGGLHNGEKNIQFQLTNEIISGVIFENKQTQLKINFQTIKSLKDFLNEFKNIIFDKNIN